MPNYLLFTKILISSIFLTGCVNSLPPRPWFEGEKDWPTIVRYEIELNGGKMPIELAYSISCADEKSLWVYAYIHNFSRQDTNIRTRYFPENAFLVKENGESVKSDKKLYRILSRKESLPTSDFYAQCKNDLTWSYSEVNDKLTLNSTGVLYRFKTAAPHSNSRWKLNLGSILIDNVEIKIPEQTVVLREKQFYLKKIQ